MPSNVYDQMIALYSKIVWAGGTGVISNMHAYSLYEMVARQLLHGAALWQQHTPIIKVSFIATNQSVKQGGQKVRPQTHGHNSGKY